MTIKWGDPIECNGVRPDWLRDETVIQFENSPDHWLENRTDFFGWAVSSYDSEHCPRAIRLPADHPAYVALARGFTPWSGGGSAPDDWDGGKCLARSGRLIQPVFWSHPWNATGRGVVVDEEDNASDVIGYRKRNTRFDEPHLARIEVEGSAPVDGVFIKRMTEAEATEFANKAAFDGLGHTAPCYAASGAHACLKALGLIRSESRAERFTRETGHAVTEAVEAALNWKGE